MVDNTQKIVNRKKRIIHIYAPNILGKNETPPTRTHTHICIQKNGPQRKKICTKRNTINIYSGVGAQKKRQKSGVYKKTKSKNIVIDFNVEGKNILSHYEK